MRVVEAAWLVNTVEGTGRGHTHHPVNGKKKRHAPLASGSAGVTREKSEGMKSLGVGRCSSGTGAAGGAAARAARRVGGMRRSLYLVPYLFGILQSVRQSRVRGAPTGGSREVSQHPHARMTCMRQPASPLVHLFLEPSSPLLRPRRRTLIGLGHRRDDHALRRQQVQGRLQQLGVVLPHQVGA